LEETNKVATKYRAFGRRIVEKREIGKLELAPILAPEKVIVAEEKVYTYPKALV
jgi:hypothetical protein